MKQTRLDCSPYCPAPGVTASAHGGPSPCQGPGGAVLLPRWQCHQARWRLLRPLAPPALVHPAGKRASGWRRLPVGDFFATWIPCNSTATSSCFLPTEDRKRGELWESRRRPPSTGSDSTRCSECTEPSTFHWQQNRSRKFASSILSTTRRDLPCLPRHPATAGNAGWVQLRRSTRASCCHEASAARCQTGQVSTSNPSPGSLPSWNYAQKRHDGD